MEIRQRYTSDFRARGGSSGLRAMVIPRDSGKTISDPKRNTSKLGSSGQLNSPRRTLPGSRCPVCVNERVAT